MGQGSLFLCPIRKAGYGQATSPVMPIKFNKSMAQLNGNYLNGTNIAVLGTSAHETSEIMVYEHPLFGKVRMFIKMKRLGFAEWILQPLCSIQIRVTLSQDTVNHRAS